MDDPAGREEATRRALRTTGTLGILAQAAVKGFLDFPSVFTRLVSTTTSRARVSLLEGVLARATARKERLPAAAR